MHLEKTPTTSLAIFCKVVDNYGDIGICWRLARQLEQEHQIAVTLWVDDLHSFQRICPAVNIHCDEQRLANVVIKRWHNQEAQFTPDDIADIVIEFFACDIPPAYITAMSMCVPRPVWLNLEGLTAEEWVEGCHTLPSPHPRLPLTKHFFFPGFTNKTGGLLLEAELEKNRKAFQSDPVAIRNFLAQLGVTPPEMTAFKVSLFCYPQAPVSALFKAWESSSSPVICLVPEGVASSAVGMFLGEEALAGTSSTRGALTVRVLPFVPQPDYDKLLWACDLNFVRGEDSFVRAQWAGKPFIWHIYPQDENLHHVKLKAFLQRYSPDIASAITFSLAWNNALNHEDAVDWSLMWPSFLADIQKITNRSIDWQAQLHKNGDLSSNLLRFARLLK
ncbi:elongation factor P maturation arginine rhamnosyltransferase EarP [Undibacterium sp. Rencai35W]|uniref:elongation factor P maturation arginine rhamnosyltransferase EarP n=1 Tax=Undibacterium sp. Rencai35W TaxID=3413046 RepID=UPI003BF3A388